MLKRVGAVAVVVALAAGGSAAPGAAQRKKHTCKIDLTALIATVKVNSGNPPIDGADTFAGSVDGKFCGKAFHGALRGVNTFTAPGKFNTKIVTFSPRGTTKSVGSGSGTLNPDGSVSFSGSAKVVGGTGLTKGATGSYKFDGTQAKDSNVAVQHAVGSINY